MENTSQLQCEQAKQEGLIARLASKSPSAPGKGQHVVALFLERRKDQVVTKSSLPSAESYYSPPQEVCSCTGFRRDTGKFLLVSLPQSFFIAIPPVLGRWRGMTHQQKQDQKSGNLKEQEKEKVRQDSISPCTPMTLS